MPAALDAHQKKIALVLTALVACLTTMAEGQWWPDATVWLQRVVALVAVVSSVMGWGIVGTGRRP